MKQCGIWLDSSKAFLVQLENGKYTTEELESEVENYHPKGGSRSKVPYGPMEKLSESKYLDRKKQQLTSYFKSLAEKLKTVDELFLFGPGQSKLKFKEYMNEHFKNKSITTGTTDKMTENQIVAKVKHFFSEN